MFREKMFGGREEMFRGKMFRRRRCLGGDVQENIISKTVDVKCEK